MQSLSTPRVDRNISWEQQLPTWVTLSDYLTSFCLSFLDLQNENSDGTISTIGIVYKVVGGLNELMHVKYFE